MFRLGFLIVAVLGLRTSDPAPVQSVEAGDITATPLTVGDTSEPKPPPPSIPDTPSTITVPPVNIVGLTNSTLEDTDFPACEESEFCRQVSASVNATPITLSPAAKAQQDLISSTTK